MPSSTSTVKVYLVGPDPIGADLPGTTCQVPLPFGTKLSPGGRAAAESPLLVPDGTGPVELLCDVDATADPRTAGATARTGTVAAEDAVAQLGGDFIVHRVVDQAHAEVFDNYR